MEIEDGGDEFDVASRIFPHVTGLCRAHHDAVESHDAWIKLEDGEFVWYDRMEGAYEFGQGDPITMEQKWSRVGPLNPQPGSREGKPKRKRLKGQARRQRKTISIKVPNDTEDGGAVWDELLDRVKERLIAAGLYDEADTIPVYEALVAALNDWLNS